MALGTILWVDDEIENLQSQKLFLENQTLKSLTEFQKLSVKEK